MTIGIINSEKQLLIEKIEVTDLKSFRNKLKDYFWSVDNLFDSNGNIILQHYDLDLFQKFCQENTVKTNRALAFISA